MFKVYCDLDGVIYDFESVYEEMGGTVNGESLDKDTFSRVIWEEQIFTKLPLLPRAQELVNRLRNLSESGLACVEILSSTGSPNNEYQQKEVARQKSYALKRDGINFTQNYTKHRGNKKLFATPKSILIDDDIRNVNEFIEFGGYGYHYTKSSTVDGIILYILDKIVHHHKNNIY